jgi:hypothetical protein
MHETKPITEANIKRARLKKTVIFKILKSKEEEKLKMKSELLIISSIDLAVKLKANAIKAMHSIAKNDFLRFLHSQKSLDREERQKIENEKKMELKIKSVKILISIFDFRFI